MSEEDKKYLREFDDAVERGFFRDDKIKFSKKVKNEIGRSRDKFREDIMYVSKREFDEISDVDLRNAPKMGKKRVNSPRDENGKFKKKDVK